MLAPGTDFVSVTGELTFAFLPDERVFVRDARADFDGDYTVEGDTVTISLPNATYEGVIDGLTIRGKGARDWDFEVRKID
jgi:hypothetical protein